MLNIFCDLLQLNPYNYERIEKVLKTIQTADEGTTLLPLNQVRFFFLFYTFIDPIITLTINNLESYEEVISIR